MEGFTDADFTRDIESRKSSTGYVFVLRSEPVTWRSNLQNEEALSSTESVYIPAFERVKEVMWFWQLLKEAGMELLSPTLLHIDNQST